VAFLCLGVSVLIFGYKDDLMLSIMADTGKMKSVEDVRLFGNYIREEIKSIENALFSEYKKQEKA
jgi:hypothetical protein